MENQVVTTVVMVTYHTGKILDKSIGSVLQTTLPIELIVVNNGNPPDVERKLKAMSEADPRLKLLTGHGNIGYAKAANLGAKEASGKFLLFLHPDALLPKEAFERLYAIEAKLKPPFMLGAKLVNRAGKEQKDSRRVLYTPQIAFIKKLHLDKLFPTIKTSFDKIPLPAKISPVPSINGTFIFMHAESFWYINGFDEAYFMFMEDMDLCRRFTESGGTIYFIPTFAVLHDEAVSHGNTPIIAKYKAQSLVHYFHSNFGHSYPQPVLWGLDLLFMAPHWLCATKDKMIQIIAKEIGVKKKKEQEQK